MTITETEALLKKLEDRHKDLTQKTLETLLVASGWEDSAIKEAVALYKTRVPKREDVAPKSEANNQVTQVVVTEKPLQMAQVTIKTEPGALVEEPVSDQSLTVDQGADAITFYHPDGRQEDALNSISQQKIEEVLATAPIIGREVTKPKKASFISVFFGAMGSLIGRSLTKRFFAASKTSPVQTALSLSSETTKDMSGFRDGRETASVSPTSVEVTTLPKIETMVTLAKNEEKKEAHVETPAQIIAHPSSVDVTTLKEQSRSSESLVVHEETKDAKVSSEHELPSDLPLVPFETSRKVWSFAKYRDLFHGSDIDEEYVYPKKPVDQKITEVPVVEKVTEVPKKESLEKVEATTVPEPKPQKVEKSDIEVVVEDVPLNKEDTSLVILASIMLLVIILILGYMYGEGRL